MSSLFALLPSWLAEPLSYGFMQNALLAAVAVSVVCAALSCFVVLKGWSLMGDAVSHAILPGVVLAFSLGLPLGLGAFAAGLFCAAATGYLKQYTRIKEDTLTGVVFTAMFAVGLLMFQKSEASHHLKHILFGNLLGIGSEVLWQTVLSCLVIFGLILLKKKDFLLYCFDSDQARISGLSVPVLHYGLLALLSAVIVLAMQAVGAILVVAMLITPGLTALLICRRFNAALWTAIAVSCLSAIVGVFLSYFLNSATGATIILLQSLMFLLALAWVKWHKAA